ncbi:efflux RND transporter permease subunit [Candidatus Vampirococcus lugosii]|uniref:Multidrug efflux pump subunit AcrB n=1 Tax=Candidatus Vampirococcus lugosii TaxID=2789015 RepID=A0ABS5QKM3_9BACT|nr:efflux RND transporter permease subunit [Candidatus Vampirococcus lugosii]MBS8121787.1 Multidrug efflux pump subunit AcrB [Candidatus Vampirococcus lugosii]
MFGKYAEFWIKNPKLTIILMIVILIWGLLSWFVIPKQYNPDIEAPTFIISAQAPGYTAKEVNNLLVSQMEMKFKEIEDVKEISGNSMENFGSVMVMFEIGTDKEKATTRLYNKIYTSLDFSPMGISQPSVMSIDPNDIPIFSFAIYNTQKDIPEHKNLLKLKDISIDIVERLKLIDDTTVFYNIGAYNQKLIVRTDLEKLSEYNVDMTQILGAISQNNQNFYGGKIKYDNIISDIQVKGEISDLSSIENIIVANYNGNNIYLSDLANVYFGIGKEEHFAKFSEYGDTNDAVFIGLAKSPSANSIFVVNEVKQELEKIKSELPASYEIVEIQNEGYEAENATNMLIINLFQAIFIVFIVLFFYLGFKDAINNSIAIPLTLAIVFGIALAIGDNVNRITLFAVILVLGMLVDNSTVIVENISRHLKDRETTGVDKLTAIKTGVQEVGFGVILATITRILAFISMFFVTDMMGEYMGPIPKYAIIALSASFFIAMSINPFFAYFLTKKDSQKSNKKNNIKQENIEIKQTWIEKKYKSLIELLLTPKTSIFRKIFKAIFWIVLIVSVVVPIYYQVFKAQMLPKSDKNQFYIWIDAPRDWSIDKTKDLLNHIDDFVYDFSYESDSKEDENLKIIKSTSSRGGIQPVPDFASVFRGSYQRQMQNQLSIKINLIKSDYRDIFSQDFVIQFRPLIKKYIDSKYPEVEIRLLEEPPGPPVQSTFMLKISGMPDQDYENVGNFAKWIQEKIKPSLVQNQVVDIYNSFQEYQTTYKINLDQEKITRLGLNIEQIGNSLYSIFEGLDISPYHDQSTKKPINIFVTANQEKVNDINIFDKIYFTSKNGKQVPLLEIADIIPQKKAQTIMNNDMLPTVYIYGEIGEDSIVYPSFALLSIFLDKKFWQDKFEIISWNLYGFKLKEKLTGNNYEVNFGGEREVTMDTFADMGIAMIIALLGIYFIIVAQFKSFTIGGIVMITFLLGFFGVFPGFASMYMINGEFFSATSMIGVIALAGIVVGNAIILIEYVNVLLKSGLSIRDSIIKAGIVRLRPIILTSLTTVLGITTILGDPVWSGLAFSIIFGLTISAVLTLIVVPVFLYDNLIWQDQKLSKK